MTTFKLSQVAPLMISLALVALTGCVAEATPDAEAQVESMETGELAAPTDTRAAAIVQAVVPVATAERAAEAPTKPGVDLMRDPEPQPWNDPNLRKFR
jgi:hypothetical protein